MTASPGFTYHLLQQKKAGEVMAEYMRRLAAEGIVPGEGACCDCFDVTLEQSAFMSRTFDEVCDEMLPAPGEMPAIS